MALERIVPDRTGERQRGELLREARALGRLSHPTIAGIHDIFEHEGELWIAEELIEGVSLRERIREGIDLGGFYPIAEDCAAALAYAAQAGIVHCDFKPANVMVTPEGRAKVLDFGLAQRVEST